MIDEANRELIDETDVRKIVRLLGDVALLNGQTLLKKRLLMTRLSELIEADAWSWIVSRAAATNNNPAVGGFLYGGLTDQEFAAYARMMQDRENTPIEYQALNQLRLTNWRFTRSWDQLVSAEDWYGPANRRMMDQLGFEHVMYCVRVLDDDGLFSGIAFKRRLGRPNFTAAQRRIAHIVTGEIDWLHFDHPVSEVTRGVQTLSPQCRAVLTLLIDGKSVKEIAGHMELSVHTVNDHCKVIHKHFDVHTRAELLRYFMVGDGGDVAASQKSA